MAPGPIAFYFDFSSPYSYIASEWIEALAARHARTVRWHAILLGVTFQAAELRSPVARSDQARILVPRLRALGALRRRAAHQSRRSFRSRRRTRRASSAGSTPATAARATGWARHCLRAYFARGVDLSDAAALKALAADFGLDANEAEAVWSDAQWKLRLKSVNEAAIAAGVFGAPFFIIDGEPFWGNDRRPQIERWLARGRSDEPVAEPPQDGRAPLGGPARNAPWGPTCV